MCGAAGPIEQVTNVVLNTLALAGRQDIPVAAGAWRPIVGNAKADMEAPVHFEKRLVARFGDRLKKFNPPAPTPLIRPIERHAVDFILAKALGSPGEITLVATGPMTNLAMAFLQEPRLRRRPLSAWCSSAEVSSPGNMTPLSEYNVWADPEAARIVLNAGVETILVPLDVCEDNRAAASMLTRDDLADLAGAGDHPALAMIQDSFPDLHRYLARVFRLGRLSDGRHHCRRLAFDPTLCTMTEPLFVDVVLDGRIARGQTVAYRGRQLLPAGGPKSNSNLHGHRRAPLHGDLQGVHRPLSDLGRERLRA